MNKRHMSTFTQLPPVPVNQQRLYRLNELYNIGLKTNIPGVASAIPIFKVGFIGKGTQYLDRMFTVEERLRMLFFVRNVNYGENKDEIRRSWYVIPLRMTKYIHLSIGITFSDFFDYAHLEEEEVSQYVTFYYNGNPIRSIREASNVDADYKSKTRIRINASGYELMNDMQTYGQSVGLISQVKVGYYIPDESIRFYHAVEFLPNQFGLVLDQGRFFYEMDNDPDAMYKIANYTFADPRQYKPPKLTKKGTLKTQPAKNPFLAVSLMNHLEGKSEQDKLAIIGWFICEILYSYIFTDTN